MSTLTGQLRSIQIGIPRIQQPASADDQQSRPWTTGIFKRPVLGPIWLGLHSLQGDGQADLVHHGGIDKAVCAYPSEHWAYWSGILPPHLLSGGAFGENFTLQGLTEAVVCIGDVFSVGSAVVQVSQPRQPCWKLARRWAIKDLAVHVERTGFTGWYFRVTQAGTVEPGARLQLIDRPCPEWTIATANRIMHHERDHQTAAEHLSLCPFLSSSWQQTLRQRCHNQEGPELQKRRFGNTHP
jgi:MOSC domain-containing protein YiiM